MLNMETNNLISKANRRLKRKRPYVTDLPSLDSDLLDYDTYCNEFNHSSETSSPSSSSSSDSLDNRFNFMNRNNPNKIFVTEERMAKALRELQIQTSGQRPIEQDMHESASESESSDNENEFYVTNELKQSLRLLDKQNENDLNKLISITSNDRSQMQLIPYIPLSSFIDPTDVYLVEEPTDIARKNLLKRTYSQVNKLTIEELKQSDSNYSSKNHESQAYVVEFEEDNKNKNNKTEFKLANDNQTSQFNFNKLNKPYITITELEDQNNSVLSRFNKTNLDFKEEEAMDM